MFLCTVQAMPAGAGREWRKGCYWYKAQDRILRLPEVKTPVSFIVQSRREVNTALHQGQYFFVDIRREGIVLYELDDEPLAMPKPLSSVDAYEVAARHFGART